MSLTNIWHLRTVAESSSKPCYICFKPTTSVLITPDNKDYFYVCRGHLKDNGFCSPVVDEAELAAKKKKEEMDHEIELIKKEYDEKMKKKKSKDKKDKEVDGKDKKKEEADSEYKKAEKEKDDKIKAISDKQPTTSTDDIPRIYALHKMRNFFQMRLDRLRNAGISKRNRERLKNPTAFPSVPTGNP